MSGKQSLGHFDSYKENTNMRPVLQPFANQRQDLKQGLAEVNNPRQRAPLQPLNTANIGVISRPSQLEKQAQHYFQPPHQQQQQQVFYQESQAYNQAPMLMNPRSAQPMGRPNMHFLQPPHVPVFHDSPHLLNPPHHTVALNPPHHTLVPPQVSMVQQFRPLQQQQQLIQPLQPPQHHVPLHHMPLPLHQQTNKDFEDIQEEQKEEDGKSNFSAIENSFHDCMELEQQHLQAIGVVDIDKTDDVRACSEHAASIFALLRQDEQKYFPMDDYMPRQNDINITMRSVLVDWLNEVAQEYKLRNETLYLAVNYTDRYLSQQRAERSELQLIGVCCVLIASKYYEAVPPAVDEFVFITDNTYKRSELLRMESHILNTLQFNLTVVTVMDFLSRFLLAGGIKSNSVDKRPILLSNFLAELTLQDYKMLKYKPSMIAASSVVYSLYTLKCQHWSPTLRYHTNYEAHELIACVNDIFRLHCEAVVTKSSNLNSVVDKYSRSKLLRIAKTPVPPHAPLLSNEPVKLCAATPFFKH